MRYLIVVMIVGVLMAPASCSRSIPAVCTAVPAPTALVAVYPIDGATSVPDSPQSIVFARFRNIPLTGLRLVLTPPSGPSILANPGPAPSPLPTPNTPAPAGTTLVGFTVPTLAAATTYQATFKGVEDPNSVCGPGAVVGSSSFTTQ